MLLFSSIDNWCCVGVIGGSTRPRAGACLSKPLIKKITSLLTILRLGHPLIVALSTPPTACVCVCVRARARARAAGGHRPPPRKGFSGAVERGAR